MITPRSSLLVLVLAAGCGLTPERIAAWKTTPEGREKLVAALRDGALPVERRAEAAAALTEVGWVDRVEGAVADLPLDDRARVLPAIPPLVAHDLGAADGARAWDAREALFALRRQSTTDEGTRAVDGKLLPVLEQDLRTGHVEGGRHSVKEMLIAIGPPAAPLAGRVVADPKAPFAVAVEVLEKVGDKAAREAAGAALVDRARGGAPASDPLWQALGTMGGPRVVSYLEEKIEAGGDQAEPAARTLPKLRRDPALLSFALKVAGNAAAPPAVRKEMLGLAQSIGGDEARKGLVAVIGADPDPAFRFSAYEGLVKADAKSIVPALEAFPVKDAYDEVAVHEHLVTPLVHMGWPAREGIFKALQSPSPLARLTAVWALEKVGFNSDAAALTKLTADKGKVKGITPAIGAEATRIAATLKKAKT
jgi:hypothetical protein